MVERPRNEASTWDVYQFAICICINLVYAIAIHSVYMTLSGFAQSHAKL